LVAFVITIDEYLADCIDQRRRTDVEGCYAIGGDRYSEYGELRYSEDEKWDNKHEKVQEDQLEQQL
jgi:hypothetical protein